MKFIIIAEGAPVEMVSKKKGKKQGGVSSGVQQQGEYRLEDGVRHVEPYIYTHSTHAKGRWYGREVLEGTMKKREKKRWGKGVMMIIVQNAE
jgi:hypothetical protein